MHCLINKWSRWYWQNLFVLKRFKWNQVQIFNQKVQYAGIKHLNDPSVQIWMTFMRILMIITQTEKKKLTVFDDMIADIMINKKFQTIIKQLFIRCRKLNILLVFITQSYFSVFKRCHIKFNTLFDYEH